MLRYITQRLLLLIPVMLGVTILVFVLMELAPGDAASALLGEMGQGVSQASLDKLKDSMGLNDPIYVRFGRFVGGIARGDLGTSLRTNRRVVDEISERFPYTLQLTLAALLLAVVVAVPAGIVAAVKRNSKVDLFVMVGALLGVSVPAFWLGLLLMIIFSLKLGWLPASGSGTWMHLVLPAVTIAWASMAFIARMTRSAMLDVLNQDYVRTAKAKGLTQRAIVMKHALRNALIPVATTIGLQFGALLGGAVLTETIFAWPGLGRLTVQAIQARDLPMVEGSILFVALIFTLVNLAVDILYVYLDPRVQYN